MVTNARVEKEKESGKGLSGVKEKIDLNEN